MIVLLAAQSVIRRTVITCPLATVVDETGDESTEQLPPLAATDHMPSVVTSPEFATAWVVGAVKPAGIVKVGLAAPRVIPAPGIVKTVVNV